MKSGNLNFLEPSGLVTGLLLFHEVLLNGEQLHEVLLHGVLLHGVHRLQMVFTLQCTVYVGTSVF